jgi:hypothetical protein
MKDIATQFSAASRASCITDPYPSGPGGQGRQRQPVKRAIDATARKKTNAVRTVRSELR